MVIKCLSDIFSHIVVDAGLEYCHKVGHRGYDKTLKNESFNDLFYWYFSWYLSWYPFIYSNGLFYCQFTFSRFLGVTETSNHDNRAAIAFLI
jgi:hypothetical protein